ncbi:DNA-binding transcriptional LysR family regulator [Nocardioides sp. BE266]|uniref:LysR family transcriptional regulator n=1 Tax=Nocardioides sp. BE266 TaxID=2817725 RepID=UPI00286422CE|nr:LysR family transcriptional regulator [Nocardioides sp. BE266]MDR7253091.1 DNA-binding transcriptional LysR family regulator [Nocardioides sp. BE266]
MLVLVLIRDLEWLLALAEHGHVTDAASALGTSQPTLSRALARIEDELGVRVFERVPTGIVLTADGELVLESAQELVAGHDRLRAALANRLDPDTGVVRLAFLDSMATTLLPRLLRGFHEHAPGIKVVLSQEPAHDIRRDLDRGAAELGLTMAGPAEGYARLPVQEERLVVVVPATHRLARRKRLGLAELADEEMVMVPSGFGHRALVDELFADAGVTPQVSFESADLATIEGLVAAGLGVGIVPEVFAGVSGTVGITLTTPGARRTISLIWRTDRPLAPPAQRFLDFVRSWA